MERPERSNRKVLDIFLPGMINAYGHRSRFPAVSITGPSCALGCEHCKGYLLKSMYHIRTPDELLRILNNFEKNGMIGALLSGGCDKNGRMPWKRFLPVLTNYETGLYLIAHGGMNISSDIAELFKNTPIKQILIDIVGDAETLKYVYHIDDFSVMENTLKNVYLSDLGVAPHVIIGIHGGKIKGEFSALDMLAEFQKEEVILVVLMPDVMNAETPDIKDVIEVFSYARKLFKRVTLGCARPRGKYRKVLETALLENNLIDAMALWSYEGIKKAKSLGYRVRFYEGCCSIPLRKEIPILKEFYGIGIF